MPVAKERTALRDHWVLQVEAARCRRMASDPYGELARTECQTAQHASDDIACRPRSRATNPLAVGCISFEPSIVALLGRSNRASRKSSRA